MVTPAPSPALRELGRVCMAGVRNERVTPCAELPQLMSLARRHRVDGLVGAALGDRVALETAMTRAMAQAAEYRRIADGMADLEPVFLKGLAVAALGYAQPFLKHSADIDILVGIGQLEQAGRHLDAMGYKLRVPVDERRLRRWHKVSNQSVWQCGTQWLELHVRPLPIPFDERDERRVVTVAGTVPLATFGASDQFAYLALHGALSGWFRLKWLVDFAAFAALNSASLENWHRLVQERGKGPAAASAQALLLSNGLLGLDLADDFRRELHDVPGARRLIRLSLALLEGGEPLDRRFGTLPIHAAFPIVAPGLAPSAKRLHDIVAQRLLA